MAGMRQSMKMTRISDIVSATFHQGDRETMKAAFVSTRFGENISRAKVVGTVIEKFISEDGKFASVTIDDGTAAIRARVFADDSKIIENVNVGELVVAVGKMKNFRDENYIAPDFVKRIDDPNNEILFKLQLLGNLYSRKKVVDDLKNLHDQMSDEELQEYATEKYGIDKETLPSMLSSEDVKVDYKPVILEIIDKLDEGSGVEVGKLLEQSKLEEGAAEGAISELIASGELYEPTVGKLKRVVA